MSVPTKPTSGLWVFDEENNGKPGRGFQIDRQENDIVVVSYYGYRNDGTAVFYQATGSMSNGKLQANLLEYKNGRQISGEGSSAEVAQNLGEMQIEFSTENIGVVKLPGQSSKTISLYGFSKNNARLANSFKVTLMDLSLLADGGIVSMPIPRSGIMKFFSTKDKLSFTLVGDEGTCFYEGNLTYVGGKFESLGYGDCTRDGDRNTYPGPVLNQVLKDFSIDEYGVLSGNWFPASWHDNRNPLNSLKIIGVCVPAAETTCDF